MSMVSRADAYQRRHRWVGLPLAVLYKFADDQGTYLAAQITYYGFVAAFPLLLLLATILGYALHGNPHLQRQVLDSALAQFPVIGGQITADIRSFHGSTPGLVIGMLGCVYGGLGIVQAVQTMLNKVWGVPRDSRPNPVGARLRSLLLLAFGGASVIATTVLSALASAPTPASRQPPATLVSTRTSRQPETGRCHPAAAAMAGDPARIPLRAQRASSARIARNRPYPAAAAGWRALTSSSMATWRVTRRATAGHCGCSGNGHGRDLLGAQSPGRRVSGGGGPGARR